MDLSTRVPKHLKRYIVSQGLDSYTFQDHALWRFIVLQSKSILEDRAHPSYLEGLYTLGLNTDRLPRIEEVNRVLEKVGWFAVVVNGFIPPQVYLEFQSNRILVISSDMRSINQVTYTPSPDVVHEVIGHIPLMVDKEYSEYLRRIGEIGKRALSNKSDSEIYALERHLSILRSKNNPDLKEVTQVSDKLMVLKSSRNRTSEINQLKNIHWWSAGFGLIGDLKSPKIYGSGILSSIGESMKSLTEDVVKVPYSIDVKDEDFDFSIQQTKLYVTPSFEWLNEVLDQFEKTMAFVHGGLEGVKKAIDSEDLATFVYNSGIQVSGVISSCIEKDDKLIYVQNSGKCQMSYSDVQIIGHGNEIHYRGLGSPVGVLEGSEKCLSFYDDDKLNEFGIVIGNDVELKYSTGVIVKGILRSIIKERERIVIMSFDDCIVSYNNEKLFEGGQYDMAVGCSIISVYHGVADIDSYGELEEPPVEQFVRDTFDYDDELDELYKEVRIIRGEEKGFERFQGSWERMKESHKDEWLLSCIIFQSLKGQGYEDLENEIKESIRETLNKLPELEQVFEENRLLD